MGTAGTDVDAQSEEKGTGNEQHHSIRRPYGGEGTFGAAGPRAGTEKHGREHQAAGPGQSGEWNPARDGPRTFPVRQCPDAPSRDQEGDQNRKRDGVE